MGNQNDHIAVLGAGSFGTSLAMVLARNGCVTTLWGRDADALQEFDRQRCNSRFLPECPFPPALRLNADLASTVATASHVLIAIPSHAFSGVIDAVADHLPAACPLVWATKGFEAGNARLLHEVVAARFGDDYPMAVLSGPTFAVEVAAALPTAVTLASANSGVAERLAKLFHNPRFRVYTSSDIIGVQVGGGVKNVMALAAGIADGLGFGSNSRAALVTRGLAELMRLGVALGGRPETFMGLAGLGDLVLTCTDDKSRNRRAGLLLGQGFDASAVRRKIGQVVEGFDSTPEVVRLAARLGVEMPISEQVNEVLQAEVSPQEAVQRLLGRAAGSET